MRILHALWGLSTGGVETMLVDIANEQVKSDDIAILVINDIIDTDLIKSFDSKIKLFTCNRRVGSKNIIPFIKMNIFVLRFNPDIIHIHMTGFVKLLLVCPTVPKVFTAHNTHNQTSDYNYYARIFSISKDVQKVTRESGFASVVIYNGIRCDKIIQKRVPCNNNRIVQVGRLENVKGQQLTLEAARQLDKKNIEFSLDIIGDGCDRKRLEDFVIENNLQKKVHFLGLKTRDYVYSHLHEYDLLVQPSYSEGFGLTIAEALCAKIAVITSNLRGPLEIIDDGKYGYVFECGNVESFVNQITRVLCGDYPKKRDVAYNYVSQNFNIKVTARRYLEEYKNILRGNIYYKFDC